MTSLMTPMTGLSDVLDHHVRTRPNATALVAKELRVAYATLGMWVDDVAAGLAAARLRRGDVVAVVEVNTVEFVVALLAAARIGLVVAPLDPALAEIEMTDRLARLGAQAVLIGPGSHAFAPTGCASPKATLSSSPPASPPGPRRSIWVWHPTTP